MDLSGHNIKQVVKDVYIKIININDFYVSLFRKIPAKDYLTIRNVFISNDNLNLDIFRHSEIDKLNTFKTLKKQVEWSAGRFAVKSLVNHFHQYLRLKEIEVSYEKEGAPFLKNVPEWNISISHSHDFAAAMVSFNKEYKIGIDIEKLENSNVESILKVAYSEREIAKISKNNLNDIYRIWTAKEAYLKLIKRGFHETLKNIEILDNKIFFKDEETPVKLFTDYIDDYHIYSYVIG